MKNKFLALILVLTLAVGFAACGSTTTSSNDKIILLLQGWTNTPTDGNDPYKKFIADNYQLDVVLNASSDFDNASTISFNSNDKPDIISFPNYTSFKKFQSQNVLMDDWTPYLQYMPNYSKVINSEKQAVSKNIFTDDGKLTALWTPADPPTWSLKLREDWLVQFRAHAAKGEQWYPQTPDQLLEFARWIKTAKNPDQSNLDVFAFTTAGGGNSLGVLGTWLPLMFGNVSIAPWGFYIDGGEIKFSTTDGSYKKMLDFLKIIQEEKLIEPVWYSQQFSDKARTYKGKIGIEWLPGVVSDYTQSEFTDKDGNIITDTTDWWQTYPLPVDPDANNDEAGYMTGAGLAGKVITVSKKAALSQSKMKKICKLIDDTYAYYDDETDTFLRGKAYDALRWGIGIEDGLQYQDIENSNLKYINTSSTTASKADRYYREKQSGAWDWGAWFSSTNDGIIQGNKVEVDKLILKIAQHNIQTANYDSKPQIGAYLEFDSADLNEMVSEMVAFEYTYATSNWTAAKCQEEYDKFIAKWKNTLKGNEFLTDAKAQFIALGLM